MLVTADERTTKEKANDDVNAQQPRRSLLLPRKRGAGALLFPSPSAPGFQGGIFNWGEGSFFLSWPSHCRRVRRICFSSGGCLSIRIIEGEEWREGLEHGPSPLSTHPADWYTRRVYSVCKFVSSCVCFSFVLFCLCSICLFKVILCVKCV